MMEMFKLEDILIHNEGFPESIFSWISAHRIKSTTGHWFSQSSPSLHSPLQIATSSWPMHRCPRVSPSSTAPMASVSLQASLGLRWCRRAVPVSSSMDQRQAKASSSALATPWRSARSSRMKSCFIKRQVSRWWNFLNIYMRCKQPAGLQQFLGQFHQNWYRYTKMKYWLVKWMHTFYLLDHSH